MCIRYLWIYDGCNHERPGTVRPCGENCPEDRWSEAVLHSNRTCERCLFLPRSSVSAENILFGIENIYISRNPTQAQLLTSNPANNRALTEPNRASLVYFERGGVEIRHETALPMSSSDILSLIRIEEQLNDTILFRQSSDPPIASSTGDRALVRSVRDVLEFHRFQWTLAQDTANSGQSLSIQEEARTLTARLSVTEERVRILEERLERFRTDLDELEGGTRSAALQAQPLLAETMQNRLRPLGQAPCDTSDLLEHVTLLELDEGADCSICKDPLDADHIPVRVKCQAGHVFGEACIKKWFVQSTTCPMDRQQLRRSARGDPGTLGADIARTVRDLMAQAHEILHRGVSDSNSTASADAVPVRRRTSWGYSDWYTAMEQSAANEQQDGRAPAQASPSFLRHLRGQNSIQVSPAAFDILVSRGNSPLLASAPYYRLLHPQDLLEPRYGAAQLQLLVNGIVVSTFRPERGYTVVSISDDGGDGRRMLVGDAVGTGVITVEEIERYFLIRSAMDVWRLLH